MADDAITFGSGLLLGIVAVAVVLWLVKQQNEGGATSTGPQMNSYNVVRDPEGRIQSVETLSGLPLDGQQHQRHLPANNDSVPKPEIGG